MTATTTPYLRITDGTTTLNLLDGTNYALERGVWAPRVAVRRASTLGGRPYTSVVEEIPLIVRGSTAATALANLGALSALLDQAERWYNDESVRPVVVAYQPHGSTLSAPLQSLILGHGGDSMVDLPLDMNDVGMLFEITGIVLRFVRDGAWYGAAETVSAPLVPAPLAHPIVAGSTFAASAAHLSPVSVGLAPLSDPAVIATYDSGFLLVASSTTRLQVIDASTMTAANFTSTADAANHPEGAGVLVYTPVATTQAASGTVGTSIAAGKRVGVVASLKSTVLSTTYDIQIKILGTGSRSEALTQPYTVDGSTSSPRLVLLGIALLEESSYGSVQILVTASAAAGTLVFDSLGLIVLDDPTSRILAIGPIDATSGIGVGHTSTLTVDPQPLTARAPRIRQTDDSSPTVNYAIPDWWRGDAFFLSTGTTIAAVWFGRNGTSTFWRAWDTAAAAPPEAHFVFTRYIAYLSPQ